MRFRGTVVLPLDKQHDRDHEYIDPAGLRFPDEEVPIFQDFDYSIPKGVVGSGKLSRAEDGSIVMEGTLDKGVGMKLAIGISVPEPHGNLIAESDFMAVGRCVEHKDPDQPDIEVIE